MPLIGSSGNCGPACFCKALDWDLDKYLNTAKIQTGHRDGKGVDPEGLVKALRKEGWKARWSQNNTVENCLDFLEEYPAKGKIFLDYFDWNFGAIDGHYVLFEGLDRYGNLKVWNPDIPEKEVFILPRSKFEQEWFDYTIDTYDFLWRVAIFAHK